MKKEKQVMRKWMMLAVLGLMTVLPTQAQSYRNSRYYNPRTDRLSYRGRNHPGSSWRWRKQDVYYGFRVGPTFTTVSSDDQFLDGSSVKTGLNVGMAMGFNIVNYSPLYLETGFYYTEKGGKGKYGGDRFTYNLDYLEMPLVFKYFIDVDNDFNIQPFLGGYLACGVAGKIKDFGHREAYSSFSDSQNTFQRFDGGIRMGCGVQYDMFYLDLTYDLGLANVSHNDFDESRNSALMLNFGINF